VPKCDEIPWFSNWVGHKTGHIFFRCDFHAAATDQLSILPGSLDLEFSRTVAGGSGGSAHWQAVQLLHFVACFPFGCQANGVWASTTCRPFATICHHRLLEQSRKNVRNTLACICRNELRAVFNRGREYFKVPVNRPFPKTFAASIVATHRTHQPVVECSAPPFCC
jgi:hypothetical protein